MLDELRIRNFAIIEQLTLTFDAGFNVITGETGAGKSIIIDAMELLVGGKADSGAVRSGADRALVEGVFVPSPKARPALQALLEREALLEADDTLDVLTLTREVRANGRTAARVNGVSVSSDVLRELGELLIDIHGQSAHLSLFKPRHHVDWLDRYADLLEVRAALTSVVGTLQGIRAEIAALTADKDALARRAERLREAVEEITAAKFKPYEEAALTAERSRLANIEQIARLAGEAHALLSGDERSETRGAAAQLAQVVVLLTKLAKVDPSSAPYAAQAQELSDGAQELAIAVADIVDDLEYNPDRLNELEERLELLKTLKRRYRCDDIAALHAYAEQARAELEALENSNERLDALRAQEEKTLRHIGELAERISKAREAAGRNLGKRIVRELQDLRMENTRFEVRMERTLDPNGCYGRDGARYAFDQTGVDKLEFVMSANVGEPLRPLAKVASGGEAARIMLALKRVLTQADNTPTLIFDEIDQGIGGRIGAVVGEKLWSLTQGHQVLCVTHLPQLAAFGDKHYKVHKESRDQRTLTHVDVLDEEDRRVSELAAMLGALGESGQQSARELLRDARQRKQALKVT